MDGKLILKDGTKLSGNSFGANTSCAGEVVFATGMVGYPEAITDPSFKGQILVFTYPLIGNYGVAGKKFFESDRIHVNGLIVCNYINTPSHYSSNQNLADWLKKEGVPALEISDTRFLAQKLRTHGTMLGKMVLKKDIALADPNLENLVAQTSTKMVTRDGSGKRKIVLFDCGAKRNIRRSLLKRGVEIITVPWNYDIFKYGITPDGIVISNGPGDPKMAEKTIQIIKKFGSEDSNIWHLSW